jgi:hypothetical protein
VDEVVASEEELTGRLAAWFRERPGVLPLSVSVLGGGDECRAVIVHGPRVGG